MPSTFSTILRSERQANGENSATWGTKANTVWDLLEDAIGGIASVSMSDANTTLTANNGTADQSRCAIVALTGALTAQRNIIVPATSKLYLVSNATTGGFSLVVKTSGGTGITVPNGKKRWVYCDATNVVDAITDLPSTVTFAGSNPYIAGGTNVAIADGGTNADDAATARTNLGCAASGANTDITSILLNQTGLVVKGGSANGLTIKPNETLSAGRTLSLVTGDADRTITLSGNPSMGDYFDQAVKSTSNPQFATIELGAASDTTISRASAGKIAVEGVNVVTTSSTDTLTNKTLTSPTITGGTSSSRIVLSGETTGTLTSASANTKILASGGITLPNSVFAAQDAIIIDGNGTARTITRGSGVTMYIAGVDSATGTLTANGVMGVHWRTASICVLTGNIS